MGKTRLSHYVRHHVSNHLWLYPSFYDHPHHSSPKLRLFQPMLCRPRGFSIVELIVSMTIFIIVLVSGLELMQRTAVNSKKLEMKEVLYTQLGFAMDELKTAIEASGLDYEEYYSRNVLQQSVAEASRTFGENYGDYHQQFFRPVILNPTTTEYYDTGMNPYGGSGENPEDANAVCASSNTDCNTNLGYYVTEELFLVNAEGTERMAYALESKGATLGYTLSKVVLEGTDEDQNGFIETWRCKLPYTCNGPSSATGFLPNPLDLTDSAVDTANFIPLLLSNIVIDELAFFISPIEDPFKAYGETSPSLFYKTQIQPNVTIRITAHYQPYDATGNPVGSVAQGLPSMTLQATAKTGVTQTLETYSP